MIRRFAITLCLTALAGCSSPENETAIQQTEETPAPTAVADPPAVAESGDNTPEPRQFRFTSAEEIFTQDGLNRFVLQIEAALAQAQAEHGVIPVDAADEIARTAVLESIPASEIRAEYSVVRHRMVALLNVWRRRLSAESADYLHFGATTVDIYDTARMLQVREASYLMLEDLRDLELQLIELAQAHRDTPMIGRTLGQHALPITFGKKVSGWIGENRRHIDRLGDLLDRIDRSIIMKGAVGSYLGLGDQGIEVEHSLASQLGLPAPYLDDWHAARDVFAEYASVLALVARSQGRLGQEIFLLQSTDIGEVIERRPTTAVGSSTMPHKNNPSLSEALIQRSRVIPRLAEIVGDDMINMFERDNTSRPNRILGEISIETDEMIDDASRLIDRLDIRSSRMRENLDLSGGWILSQRFVFAMAPSMGRHAAEEHMRELVDQALETGASLYELAPADPVITQHISNEALEGLLDPTTYTGLAGAQVDAVIAATLSARENDPSR